MAGVSRMPMVRKGEVNASLLSDLGFILFLPYLTTLFSDLSDSEHGAGEGKESKIVIS